MSDTTAGVLTIVSPAVALALVHRPFGDYLCRSLDATTHTRAERLAYRLVGVASAASWSRSPVSSSSTCSSRSSQGSRDATLPSTPYGRDLGFLGEPRVDVVELNRALDARFPARS